VDELFVRPANPPHLKAPEVIALPNTIALIDPKWIGTAIPFLFVGMWIFVCFVGSRLGWGRFSSTYPCDSRPTGTSYSVPVATFRSDLIRYSGIIRVIASSGGMYFYNFILFRAFHRPFILPWSCIERIECYSWLWTRGYILHIRDSVGTFKPRVEESFAQEIYRYAPHLLPHPPEVVTSSS